MLLWGQDQKLGGLERILGVEVWEGQILGGGRALIKEGGARPSQGLMGKHRERQQGWARGKNGKDNVRDG